MQRCNSQLYLIFIKRNFSALVKPPLGDNLILCLVIGNYLKRILNILLLVLISSIVVSAQIKCKIDHYSTENGLSHDVITDIIKDREGFMWFGTWNGINRFDGHDFVSYKSSPGDSSQLKHDRIDVIVEDQSNHLWLRGADMQIYRFDKKNGQFLNVSSIINKKIHHIIEFTRIFSLSDGTICVITANQGLFHLTPDVRFKRYKKGLQPGYQLPSNSINFVHEDLSYNVWIGTTKGLGLLVKSGADSYKSVSVFQNTKAELNYTTFKEDKKYLYFGTEKGYLITYNKASKVFNSRKISSGRINGVCISKKKSALYVSTSHSELITIDLQSNKHSIKILGNTSLFSLYEDKLGYLWIEPEKYGVIRFNPFDNSYENLYQALDRKVVVKTRFKVFEDINGTVWVSMKGGGFGFYNSATRHIEYFYNEPNANRRFSNVVFDLFYDTAGVLWLSTDDNGVNKIVFQANNFNQQLIVEQAKFRHQNEIRGLLSDRKNRLWVGAKSGKLHIYHDGRNIIKDIFVNEPANGLGAVYTMLEDRGGNIWLATKGNGLWKASPVNKERTKYQLSHYLADDTALSSLTSNQIYALLEDKKGRIWVGTFDRGLNLVVGTGDIIKFIHSGPAFQNYPKQSFNKIRHLALSPQGNIWIATTDGLLVLDTEKNYQYKSYSKIPGDKESLGNNDVQFIFKDSKGRMWLGTSGGGLDLATGKEPLNSLKFLNYTTREGLPNDFVLSCGEDLKGNLWIATQNGLSKFNVAKNSFRNFDSYDGLPKALFSEASCVRMTNGNMVFGTTKGYISFDPDHILNQKIQANIVFTNLQVNNQDVMPDSDNKIINGIINYAPGIVLKHNQNIFSVDYATLDYRFNNKQAYAYRLKGFDDVWQNNKGQRRATYTNLPPGNYIFEVRSLNDDFYSNILSKRIRVTILPPPWRTWWAYIIYVILFLAVFEIIRRTALTMLRLRNKITVEQKLAELKLNFFTNVSHEIRTPLTLILNPIEELARHEHLSSQGAAYVNIVRKNANRMVRFINQLLDLRKLQSGKATLKISEVEVVSFVRNICEYFIETAEKKKITLEVESEEKELFAWIDEEKLDIVIYNLLANAFKFSADNALIKVVIKSRAPGFLRIEVIDEGIGVAEKELKDIFELYYEGEQLLNKPQKGTGIGLALSKELVELHGGHIYAEKNSPSGLKVIVELRLENLDFHREKVYCADTCLTLPAGDYKELSSATVEGNEDGSLVLLVEDNDELRTFLAGKLAEFYRVETAKNGAEGLEKARELLPDLILSDIMMPVLDGIQLLERIKGDLATSHIPVILLTARYSVESQIEGLNYGADYYITKPFQMELLQASISNLIYRRKKLFQNLVEGTKNELPGSEQSYISQQDKDFLEKIITIVEERLNDVDFNIDDVADSILMSRSGFFKKFKSLTNIAPVEFVRETRLKKAKELFSAGQDNVSTVAYSVGFNNPKYFSTCFRAQYQQTPTEYIRALKTPVKKVT